MNNKEEKLLGKIVFAEFGSIKDYPFLIGLQLGFCMNGSGVMDGGKYTVNIGEMCKWRNKEERSNAIVNHIERITDILNSANCNYVSELIGKPVEVTIINNRFEDFRILTEVL